MNKMCTYFQKRYLTAGNRHLYSWSKPDKGTDHEARRLSQQLVKCPVCGRRMKPRITFCDDGCCVYTSIPPHKIKGWWKRKNRVKK